MAETITYWHDFVQFAGNLRQYPLLPTFNVMLAYGGGASLNLGGINPKRVIFLKY